MIQKRQFVACMILLIFSLGIITIFPVSYSDSSVSYDYFLKYKEWAKDTISIYTNWGNELNNENKQLKKEIQKYEKLNYDLKNENIRLETTLKEFNNRLSDLPDKLKELFSPIFESYEDEIQEHKDKIKEYQDELKKPKTTSGSKEWGLEAWKDTLITGWFFDV